MAAIVQSPPAGHFIVYEHEAGISRSSIVIAASQDVQPGEVLAAITTAGPTQGQFQVWAVGATGTLAVAIYGVKTGAGETAAIAAIDCMAVLNGKQLVWPGGASASDKAAGAAALFKQLIKVR